MVFAFARDGGLPAAAKLRGVNARLRTPVVAILTATALPLVLVAATAAMKEGVFLSVATLATTALYGSYALPIALGAVARARGRWTKLGPWNVGTLGVVVACGAVGWSGVVIAVCSVVDVLSAEMFVGVGVVLGGWWVVRARRTFEGPKVGLAAVEAPS